MGFSDWRKPRELKQILSNERKYLKLIEGEDQPLPDVEWKNKLC
jgi:hypothetical protein